MFVDRLIEEIRNKNNPSVIGLDPRIEEIPLYIREKNFNEYGINLRGVTGAIIEFNKKIIDSLYDIVPAVKPQAAFYERYGTEGFEAFKTTIEYAKSKGLIVIADAKRNDIGSTAEAYSNAYIGKTFIHKNINKTVFNADAVTVNPYFGYDGVRPFVEDCNNYDKGIFILVKTSNSSSGEFQDLQTDRGTFIYEEIALKVNEWGKDTVGKYGYSSIGAVVGATFPKQMEKLRSMLKRAFILVPGYGRQGGTAEDAAKAFLGDGLGAVVNSSRNVIYAWKSNIWGNKYTERNFTDAARAEAIRMKEDINRALRK